MRIDGTLVKWNDDRGFGFIKSNQGGQEIFVHVSAFPKDGQRPRLGEHLSFEMEIDKEGKKRASIVFRPATRSKSPDRQRDAANQQRKQGVTARAVLLIILVALGVYGYETYSRRASTSLAENNVESNHHEAAYRSSLQQPSSSDAKLQDAYKNHANNLEISGSGTVERLLPDDNEGSRHQKFILRLNSGQTLLVSHNIDLAPRVEQLGEGTQINFYGVYEWNEKGGVIHWTHKDPNGLHEAGWIERSGTKYQ